MSCCGGADLKQTIEAFKAANLLMLECCPVDCGKKMLEKAGINNFKYLRMTDLGYVKGQTQVTDEIIEAVYEKVAVEF